MPRLLAICFVFASLCVAVGCAGSRATSDASPTGRWSYAVQDTPEGTAEGTIVLEEDEDMLAGEMFVDVLYQTVPLSAIEFDPSTGGLAFTFTLNVDGQDLPGRAEARVTGAEMTGEIIVEGFGRFPLTAERE